MIVFSDGIPVLLNDGLHIWNSGLASEQGVVTSFNTWLTDTGAGVDLSPDNVYSSQPAVRTVVNFLATNIAQVQAHAFTMTPDGDRERSRTSPLARLLANPSPTMTGFDYRLHQATDIALWDRFLALIERTGQSSWQLRRIPPRMWGFVRDRQDRPVGVTFGDPDAIMPLTRTVWHDGYPSTAKSPMECISDILIEEGESAAARRDMWKNRARVDQFIERPPADVSGDWSPGARDNFKTTMAAYRAGGARSGMIPVLEDGMKLREVQRLSPVEGQQLESRKLSRREVAAFFHVDASLVGGEGATYSNVAAYREQLYSDTLGHWFARLQQADNARLVPVVSDGSEFVEFNVGEKLRLAFDQQADIYSRSAGGPFMTRHEVRRRQNLPAIDGADTLIVPLNVGTDLDLERA